MERKRVLLPKSGNLFFIDLLSEDKDMKIESKTTLNILSYSMERKRALLPKSGNMFCISCSMGKLLCLKNYAIQFIPSNSQ